MSPEKEGALLDAVARVKGCLRLARRRRGEMS